MREREKRSGQKRARCNIFAGPCVSGRSILSPGQTVIVQDKDSVHKPHRLKTEKGESKRNRTWALRPRKDDLQRLGRPQQLVIFRLRTGLCRVLSHGYSLNLSHHTPTCTLAALASQHRNTSSGTVQLTESSNLLRESGAPGEAVGNGSSTEKDCRFHPGDWTDDLSMVWQRRRRRTWARLRTS